MSHDRVLLISADDRCQVPVETSGFSSLFSRLADVLGEVFCIRHIFATLSRGIAKIAVHFNAPLTAMIKYDNLAKDLKNQNGFGFYRGMIGYKGVIPMNAKWNAKCLSSALFLFLAFFPSHSLFANNISQIGTYSELINALIEVESGGDDGAIGDRSLKHMAYGCLQIRKLCVDDVNRAHGTDYRPEDCLNNRELSVWICERYIALYATEKRLGRKPTDEDRARIWNGGPNGYKKKSTEDYWRKVKKQMEESLRKRPQEESQMG